MKKWFSLLMCVILVMTPVLAAADPVPGNGLAAGEEAAVESAEAAAESAEAAARSTEAAAESTEAAAEETGAETEDPSAPPVNGFFGAIGNAVDYISEKAGSAGRATKDALMAAGDAISGVASGISHNTERAISKMGELTSRLQQNIESTAGRLSKAASSLSGEIGEKTSSTAAEAMDVLHEAAGTAAEGAGEVVNNAVEGAGKAVDTAVEGVHSVVHSIMQALSVVAFKGAELISVVDEHVKGLDLGNPENYEKVRQAVDRAVMAAYDHGIIGKGVSRDAIRILEELAYASTLSPDCRHQCAACGAAKLLKGGKCDG